MSAFDLPRVSSHTDPHNPLTPSHHQRHPPAPHAGLSSGNSMLGIVQDHWVDVCSFFGDAQCASSPDERAAVAKRLPKVEHNLNMIFDALTTERRRMGAILKAPLASLQHVAANQCVGSSPGAGRSPTLSSPAPSLARDGLANSPTSSLLHGNLVNQLPPCYYYLFAEDRPSPSPSDQALERVSARSSEHVESSTPNSIQLAPPAPFRPLSKSSSDPSTLLHPTPVGTTFLFLLCQYGKQNEPSGARQIILRFLTRLFKEADLPARRVTTSLNDERGKQARSLLQLFPGSSIVPLLDMIRVVGRELDPSQYAAKRRGGAGGAASSSPRRPDALSDDAERRELVLLLCELAEKAERIPELANYFVSERRPLEGPTGPSSAGLNAAASRGPTTHMSELLETLLPYLTHDCSAPGWEHRRDTCRYALSAALSLAKCPDPWMQDIIASEQRLATYTLSGARVTLLTLCKIPNNDDSEMQLLYLRDVLRFWSAVHLTAPVASQRLQLPSLVEKDFARTTVLPLLQSTDKRVYAATCLVVASALADLNSSGTLVSAALAEAVLSTRVGAKSGTVLKTGGRLEPEDENKTVSFYEYYCLCHVTSNPSLTADDRAMMQGLGYKIFVWTATEATLVLTKALATHCPHLLLRYGLYADFASLASTVIPRLHRFTFDSPCATALPAHKDEGASAAAHASPLSAARSAPHIRLGECFSPKLRLPGDALFGVSSEAVGEEVLERILTIESNCPSHMLLSAGLFMHTDEATLRKQAGFTTPAETSPTETAETLKMANAHNAWFDSNIHQAPLTLALCQILKDAQRLPLSVKLLLSGTLCVLCALPDLRVMYTLLDPEYGRLDHTLQAVRALLENEMEDDDEVMAALGAAAAAVAEDTATLNVTKYKDRAAAVEARSRTASVERAPDAASSRKETQGALVHELVSFTGALYTRQYVYSVFATNWDHFATDSLDDVPEALDVSEALRRAVAEHHEFLNTCAWLELFRMELDATVGYASLSHNLLTLQP